MTLLAVAVGVILGPTGNILLAKRQKHKTLAGLWEFPGGKVEMGELSYQALCRELAEEVGIAVHTAEPLIQIQHAYMDIPKAFQVATRRPRVTGRECTGSTGPTWHPDGQHSRSLKGEGDRGVALDVWLVRVFEGDAYGREGQEIRWVSLDELDNYPVPEANKPIIAKLKACI